MGLTAWRLSPRSPGRVTVCRALYVFRTAWIQAGSGQCLGQIVLDWKCVNMTCKHCGSRQRVSVLCSGPHCDKCVVAMMSEDVGVAVLPSWVSNEDHLGGITYIR